MKIDIKDQNVYCDGLLYKNLEIYEKRLHKNWDSWIVISGDEGDGKSSLAKQLCSIITKGKFSVDNIAWTPKQFEECVMKAPKYSAVLYDEAISGLSARKAMSGINTALISMAAQCRKRNLFVVICLPSFFDLDKNIGIHRSRGLIHVYSQEYSRGYFSFYNKEKKKILYVTGKKFYSMGGTKPMFNGRFTHWSSIDEQEYETRKDKALLEQSTEEGKQNKYKIQRDWLMHWHNEKGATEAEIANYLTIKTGVGITQQAISYALKPFRNKLIMPPA